MNFVHEKWGDLIALAVMLLGVGLTIWVPNARETGQTLIGASLLGLKLTSRSGGNGGTPTSSAPPAVKV